MQIEDAQQPPKSKAEYVYSVLLSDIHNSKIPGGSNLRATEVARRLGVSVSPVREALRRLEADRLVSYKANHGATVVDLSDEATEEFYAVRAAIEGLGARLAAQRITAAQMQQLWEIHQRMVDDLAAGDLDVLGAASETLHLTITDAGGPAFLGQHARSVRNSYPVPVGASLWLNPDLARHHLEAHQQLLESLDARDEETAERIMVSHIRRSADYRLHRGEALNSDSPHNT